MTILTRLPLIYFW